MKASKKMYNHFSRVASDYRQIRTTDVEPIVFIGKTLNHFPMVKAADVGCGAGRYALLLFKCLNHLHLSCIDINDSMLEQVSELLTSNNITNFKTIKSGAEVIPLEDRSMDCVFTFNAIHHFDFLKFIEKSGKVIRKDGRIFIYTRLRSQNARSIWGQYFPLFSERETRLYELSEMKELIQSVNLLRLEAAKVFKYRRRASLDQLFEKVKARHYSTFSLYEEDELNGALSTFQECIGRRFQDTNGIEWFDENILLSLKKDCS